MTQRPLWFLLAAQAVLMCAGHCGWSSATAQAATINGYAAMGASETAGSAYTGSWIPYLANQRGFNFGPSQSYNVAVGGATSGSLLTQGQHTAVAGLVHDGNVELAYLSISGNDFFSVASSIANGSLSGPGLTAWAQGVVTNIETAMDVILAEQPLGMIVAGVPDVPLTPGGRTVFVTPTEIERGEAAVNLVNSLLEPAVLARGQVYVDLAAAMRDLNAAPFVVAGVAIDMVTGDPNPTHFFQDSRHPAAVGNGFFANIMLSAANIGYGTTYAPFTDLQIRTTAGLLASYTAETSDLDDSTYVVAPHELPEPSAFILAAFAFARLAAGRWRCERLDARAGEFEI